MVIACTNGHKEMVDLLLAKGAAVNDGYSVSSFPC